jgi:hypothetical protein
VVAKAFVPLVERRGSSSVGLLHPGSHIFSAVNNGRVLQPTGSSTYV